MKKNIPFEVWVVTIGVFIVVTILNIFRGLTPPLTQLGIVGIPLVFIYVPWILGRWFSFPMDRSGIGLGNLKTALVTCLIVSAIIFPVFLSGFFAFWKIVAGREVLIGIPDHFATTVLWTFLGVALPEEIFFRGYLQTRLMERFPKGIDILGVKFGWGILLTSVVFALFHLITNPAPARLAVFFPALVFSWLKQRTQSVAAPALFHTLANLSMVIFSL